MILILCVFFLDSANRRRRFDGLRVIGIINFEKRVQIFIANEVISKFNVRL